MKTGFFESVEISDVGRKRKNNEDACLRIPERGVFCVADGMGGQAGGDLASEAIVTAVQEVFSKAGPDEDLAFAQRVDLFRKGVNQASKWIKNFSDEKVIGQMGSTVVALVIDPRNPVRAVGLHAGDSRLYRYRAGALKLLTADHSAVAALAAKLGRDPASLPARYQNELLRCVGPTESVELEKTPVEVRGGDLFLICSDGLTRMVPDDAIAAILMHGAGKPIDDVAQTLIAAANAAGGRDNVSVVLVRVGDISGAHGTPDPRGDEEPDLFAAAVAPEAPTPSGRTEEAPPLPDTVDMAQGHTPHPDDFTPSDPTPDATRIGKRPVPGEGGGTKPKRRSTGKGGKRSTLGIVIFAAVLASGAGVWSLARPRPKPPRVVALAPEPESAPAAGKTSEPAPILIRFAEPAPPEPAPVPKEPVKEKKPGGFDFQATIQAAMNGSRAPSGQPDPK
jgi:serine/threonine protein phosphatase PrpC